MWTSSSLKQDRGLKLIGIPVTYMYFGVHQVDSVLHILPVAIDVVHVSVSRVQAGKTTGDSVPEGNCSNVDRSCAVEL